MTPITDIGLTAGVPRIHAATTVELHQQKTSSNRMPVDWKILAFNSANTRAPDSAKRGMVIFLVLVGAGVQPLTLCTIDERSTPIPHLLRPLDVLTYMHGLYAICDASENPWSWTRPRLDCLTALRIFIFFCLSRSNTHERHRSWMSVGSLTSQSNFTCHSSSRNTLPRINTGLKKP